MPPQKVSSGCGKLFSVSILNYSVFLSQIIQCSISTYSVFRSQIIQCFYLKLFLCEIVVYLLLFSTGYCSNLHADILAILRVPAVMENLEKSWNLIFKFQAWKSLGI